MRRYREAYADALAAVEQFNARLSAKKSAWFWPTIAAALTSKHHWLVIACDSCDTIIDLELTDWSKKACSVGIWEGYVWRVQVRCGAVIAHEVT